MSATSPAAPPMLKIVLRKGRAERVKAGHPWVFSGEVVAVPGPEADGQFAVVEDHTGRFVGAGFVNTKSNILVRLLTRFRQPLDTDFFRRRIQEAVAYRRRYGELTGDGYRVIHAEADGLPALVVDRYGPYLVIQALALGIAERLPMIVELLREAFEGEGVVGIYERSDVPVRHLEGLEQKTGVLWGAPPPAAPLLITEGGARFEVDLVAGQKTGFFLDQRLNRARVGALSAGAKVLNAFCYSGGFTVAAALGGAAEVHSVDISPEAIALAEANARLNGVADRCSFVAANAFDHLRELEKAEEQYDVVILDPPAFTKNKGSIPGAIRGYKEINLRAMRLLKPGGLLVTASCSHHMETGLFSGVVADAAADTRRRLRRIGLFGPSPDHPVLPAAPETDYLKCLFAEVHPA